MEWRWKLDKIQCPSLITWPAGARVVACDIGRNVFRTAHMSETQLIECQDVIHGIDTEAVNRQHQEHLQATMILESEGHD